MNIEGLVLESKYPELQVLVKGPLRKVWKDGFPLDESKVIILQFDRYLCLLDDMAREQEWTAEDKEHVSHRLESDLSGIQRDYWLHERPKANAPWPTYDDTHHNQVTVIAKATGQVAEALNYERNGRPGGPRESVVKKLEELLGDDTVEAAVEDDELAVPL